MPILDALITLIAKSIDASVDILAKMIDWAVMPNQQRKRSFHARFVSTGRLLSKRNKGFCLTGRKQLSVRHSYRNALIIGGTGTGKSTVVLLPSLFRMEGSFIVHDPSGELYANTAGALVKRGYDVRILNFSNPSQSIGFNPLSRVHSSSDINKVASLLVQASLGQSKEPFWNFQAESMLAIFIFIIKTQEREYHTLHNVEYLIQNLLADPAKLDTLFEKYADLKLLTAYKAFRAYEPKLLANIVATCLAALKLFSDSAVAQVTSFDTFDMRQLRTRKTALFVQNAISDQGYYAVLTSIFFEQLWQTVMQKIPGKAEQDIFFLVDEAASLYLPSLSLAIANIRKYRAGMLLVIQDFMQLVQQYGSPIAETIRSNCFATLFFPGQSLPSALELERLLGRVEYVDKDGNRVVRPLLTNDEIRMLRPRNALLICGSYPPMLPKMMPYYRSRRMRRYARMPIPLCTSEVPRVAPTFFLT